MTYYKRLEGRNMSISIWDRIHDCRKITEVMELFEPVGGNIALQFCQNVKDSIAGSPGRDPEVVVLRDNTQNYYCAVLDLGEFNILNAMMPRGDK